MELMEPRLVLTVLLQFLSVLRVLRSVVTVVLSPVLTCLTLKPLAVRSSRRSYLRVSLTALLIRPMSTVSRSTPTLILRTENSSPHGVA